MGAALHAWCREKGLFEHLHIPCNAVTNILGGTLTVHSVVGQGSRFVLRPPRNAPRSDDAIPGT